MDEHTYEQSQHVYEGIACEAAEAVTKALKPFAKLMSHEEAEAAVATVVSELFSPGTPN